MFCPDCGAEVTEGRKFCGKCGGQLNAGAIGTIKAPASAPEIPVQTSVPASAQPVSPRKKLVYPLVALLAILGGVGWWWLHRPAPVYKVQDPGIYPFLLTNVNGKSQQVGFIDADGKVLVQPQWDALSAETISGQTVYFNEGLCGVFKDSKWGYIDTGGHMAIPTQFDFAAPFLEGLARVKLGNQFGFIDRTGQYVINPQFDQALDFHEGLAAVHADGVWGFINKTGSYSIKPHFQTVATAGFSNGFAGVCMNGKCGYIDRTGSFEIKPQFNAVNDFSEGMAAVQINGKWGYVNTSGKIVINPQFDSATTFSDGLAVVSISGKAGTINRQGKYVVNPGQYDMRPAEGDLQRVSSSDGSGLLTRDGKWIVKPSSALTIIAAVVGKVFLGEVGGHAASISISGKVLTGPYKGAMLDSLGTDIKNEAGAFQSMRTLVDAEASYSSAYPAKGFTASLRALGPAGGTPDENRAGLIEAGLATGTSDGYQFAISIPEGTSVGGTNFNYFIVAKPVAGHAGRTFCADSSGAVRYAVQGEECTTASPTI